MDVACLTCEQIAPSLGVLGYPSVSPGPHQHPELGEMKGFGWYYDGLRSIRLVTAQIENYYRFLKEHEKHQIFVGSESDEEEEDILDGFSGPKGTDPPSSSFVHGRIAYRCDRCGVTHSHPDPDSLESFEDQQISKEAAATVGEWLNSPDLDFEVGEWGSGLSGALDITEPFFRLLGPFLMEHADHGVVASVRAEAGRLTKK